MKTVVIKGVCIALAILIGGLQPRYVPPRFSVNQIAVDQIAVEQTTADDTPLKRGFVDVPTESVHASTITELPGKRFLLAWFGGSQEGAPDVKIYCCEMDWDGNFSQPKVLLDRQTLQRQTGRYISKLGNPLLYFQNGRLRFFVVSVSVGGWSGSSINYAHSDDLGKTWSPFRRLQISPLFNISAMVRCPPVAMTNDSLALPIYHEFIFKYGELVAMNKDGRIYKKTKAHYDLRSLQPCAAAINQNEAFAVLRNGRAAGGPIKAAFTTNAGQTWETVPDLPIENPDSCLALLKVEGDTLLMAGNPTMERNELVLWKSSADNLRKWTLCQILEKESEGEFSYPTLIQDSAGRVHLIYTWKRETICHRILTPSLWRDVAPAEQASVDSQREEGSAK